MWFIYRCFETGIYKGFFECNWKSLFKELISTFAITQCHIVHIFNDWDVMAAQNHRISSKKGEEENILKILKHPTLLFE